MMKKIFILRWETFLLSRYLDFFFNFFCHVGNRFDKNAKINFEAYEDTGWHTNNYNTYIVQYLKK